MRVAVIQMRPEFKKPKENLLRIAGLVVEAVRNGAQLVISPELMHVGYSFMSSQEAEPFSEIPALVKKEKPSTLADLGWSIGVMAQLASKLGVKLVWGFIEKDPDSGKLYNSQAFLEWDPNDKELTGIYYQVTRKKNRFANDFIWAAAGEDSPPIVRTKFDGVEWKVGLLICRDIRDKNGNSEDSFYEPGDSDICALSSAWGDGGIPAVTWMDFVEKNKTHLAISNRWGKEANNDFGEGGVCVIEKNGKVHCEGLRWSEDCIVYADLKKGA